MNLYVVELSNRKNILLNPNNKITDINNKIWILGTFLGKGSYGEVFEIRRDNENHFNYSCKFIEMKYGTIELDFMIQNCKKRLLNDFINKEKINHLAILELISYGNIIINNTEYIFIIVKKMASDLAMINIINKYVSINSIISMLIQIIYGIKYIHERGFIHNDIKSENILLDTKNNCYISDYGSVTKYSKKCLVKNKFYDGTLLFSSIDVNLHIGSKRSDIESLLYNLIEWIGYELPWIDTDNKEYVIGKKREFLNTDIKLYYDNAPNLLIKFKSYVELLFNQKDCNYINYNKLLELIIEEYTDESKMILFSNTIFDINNYKYIIYINKRMNNKLKSIFKTINYILIFKLKKNIDTDKLLNFIYSELNNEKFIYPYYYNMFLYLNKKISIQKFISSIEYYIYKYYYITST
ncbi:putative ser/thr protein kinase [Alphaentomopoxvirus acuprea]|uniref:non-specific serine/threonine protein kinase n=1 Tax=Alphaentomopoxvirus acuprea TaxID=62099 RepID=W6JKZ6_9POXV|nr:putative ser/thr protein kinase [Anomala cuprea entomopoxvirus]BAO49475.1 putative ser/thr protein kinase [Anomala cuprea entomopoxvirus]